MKAEIIFDTIELTAENNDEIKFLKKNNKEDYHLEEYKKGSYETGIFILTKHNK